MASFPGNSTVGFKYMPLPDPDLYIRFVEVEDSDTADGIIRCHLTTWLRSEAPTYQAISYTWGDPGSNTGIMVNGEELRVRLNCEYALRQARWHGGSQYFWIDSICINQTDVLERSRQVALMDQVFRNSINVLACLGPHFDDSELFMEFLGKNADFLIDRIDRQTLSNLTTETTEEWYVPGPGDVDLHNRRKHPIERTGSGFGNVEEIRPHSGSMAAMWTRISDWRSSTKRKTLHLTKNKGDVACSTEVGATTHADSDEPAIK